MSGPKGKNVAEPELLLRLSRYDAFHVAADYGLAFPEHTDLPSDALVKRAAAILSAQDSDGFIACAAEVGSALPLNGGTYTVLLNTTNKKIAAGAAVLTLLSYIATAVISATEAMHYANHIVPVNVLWATVVLLAIFAVLNIVGIAESGKVALGIFVFHMVTLTVLSVAATWRIALDPALLPRSGR